MAEEQKKLSDEERFQLDIPPEQEDTRAEDEYNQEGLFYKDLDNIITGYEKHGVFRDHKASVASVLKMLLEKTEKESCDHPRWIRDPKSGDYNCEKCKISLDSVIGEATRIPSMPEREVTIKMSLRSWNNFDNDLKVAEHHLVGVLARIRNIRVNISHAMDKKLVDQARGNLIKTMELGERMEEHGRELEKLAKDTKGEDAKEA